MNAKRNLHQCADCNNFAAIYQKRAYNFEKTNLGICFLKQGIVKKESGCEFYKRRTKKTKTVTIEHIDAVIECIKELERILYNVEV